MSALGKSTRKIIESDALTDIKAIQENRIECSTISSPENAKEFVKIVFSTPVPADKSYFGQSASDKEASASSSTTITTPLHIALIVGAGKLQGRSKFDEALPKWLTLCLREISYKDDRDIVGEPGTFKYMHDTGKNEKVIVVYPLITPLPETKTEEEHEEEETDDSPEWKCLSVESEEIFTKMVEAKTPLWTLKKRLIGIIENTLATFSKAEEKLVKLEELNGEEKKIYDNLNVENLKKKISILHKLMSDQVETGHITPAEKNQLIANIQSKIDGAEASDPEKLKQLTSRKAKLQSLELVPGLTLQTLKREQELFKLWKKQIKIKMLEEKAGAKHIRSGNVTPDEVKEILSKEEVEATISQILVENRFWYETDEEWKSRIEENRKRILSIKPTAAKKSAAGNKPAPAPASKPGASASSSDGFKTVSGTKSNKGNTSSSSSKGNSGNKFSALF